MTEKFVAVRKTERIKRMGELTKDAPTDFKRSQILPDANVVLSRRAKELKAIGLEQFQPTERIPAEQSGFQRLGYVGAYVVNAEDKEQAEAAKEKLEEDYFIMPNIELSIPHPNLGARNLRLMKRKNSLWPEISGIQEAHENGITGGGVLVGVLDTGCDCDHEEFSGKRVDFRYISYDRTLNQVRSVRGFDPNGHGTHVCGIIAGQTVGIAPDVELMVAAVIESETLRTSLERIIIALDWMLSQLSRTENITKPTIVNMSLGFKKDWIGQESDWQIAMQGMKTLLRTLFWDFDVLPIVAIGNDGPGSIRLPGGFDEVLSVGAVDFERNPAPFSGGGSLPDSESIKPDIVGYGVDIISSFERDVDDKSWYARLSGTSMAAPYVTGIASLIASANRHLQGEELRRRLLGTTFTLEHPKNRVGSGLAVFPKWSRSP